jgi:hypothetical protein
MQPAAEEITEKPGKNNLTLSRKERKVKPSSHQMYRFG